VVRREPARLGNLLGIDEFHPRSLERTADRLIIGAGERGRGRHEFGGVNGAGGSGAEITSPLVVLAAALRVHLFQHR
jgi:hypothetical protein